MILPGSRLRSAYYDRTREDRRRREDERSRADVCSFCGHERLPYQVGGLRNGHQDPTICPACGYDKTAAAEKEHGG